MALATNDSDATTVPPHHVGGEWSHGSGGKRTNHAAARSEEHVLGGTSTREHAATTMRRNAVFDDSLTAKSAFTPIAASTAREHGQHSFRQGNALASLTPHQHHESSNLHCNTTRQRSQFTDAQPRSRNAVSLSTPRLKIVKSADQAAALSLGANTNPAATSLTRSGEGKPNLKVNTDATNPRYIPQLSTLTPATREPALICKSSQLESQREWKYTTSAPPTRDGRLLLSPSHISLNDTVAHNGQQLEHHIMCAANTIGVIATSKDVQRHGQNCLLAQQSLPLIPVIPDYSAETVTATDKKTIRSVVTTNQPKRSVLDEQNRAQFQGGLEAEKRTGNGSSNAPQSSAVRRNTKKSRKRNNKDDDDTTGAAPKPKIRAPRRKRAARQPNSSTNAKEKASAERQDNVAEPLVRKTRKRKNKAAPTTEQKTKKRRLKKATPGVNADDTHAVTGAQKDGKEVRVEMKSAPTPVPRSAFLEKGTRRLPPPRESDDQYGARLAVGGDSNTIGSAAGPRLAALNFGGLASNVRLPPIPKEALLRARCKRQAVELDEGMAHDKVCAVGVDRSKEVSKALQTDANATMSETRKEVTVQTSGDGGDDRKVERHECTSAVDSHDENVRLRKEVQMLRALLLWKESGNAGRAEKTVSNTNEETIDTVRLGCGEGSGPIERTLKAVRMVRLGELLSVLDSDVVEACGKMGEMMKHVLVIRREKSYEHCVYEGMQFIAGEMRLGAACDKSIESVLAVFDVVKRALLAVWHGTRRGEASASASASASDSNSARFNALLSYVSDELREWMRWACLSWSDTICCKMGGALRAALQAHGCARGSEALRAMFAAVLRETQPLLQGALPRDRDLCRGAELATCIARAARACTTRHS